MVLAMPCILYYYIGDLAQSARTCHTRVLDGHTAPTAFTRCARPALRALRARIEGMPAR